MIHTDEAHQIAAGRHADPFAVLGMHMVEGKPTVRVFAPHADRVEVLDAKTGKAVVTLDPHADAQGLFTGTAPRRKAIFPYRLRFIHGDHVWEGDDPYRFGPVMGEMDEHLFNEGAHRQL